ncbi:hypothetical protein [Streptomyces wuyuanensis]|uniref:Integral membrane protein n=1 Tax=Streptomyces wuyuanensis TaxID=1196353 RepID=A0A1G9Q2H8_9ACTN|nr:hypothetical protein [Streptomyces wuyuanensis]SDM05234.1 hypothetical protein SAMN05444921_103247 [Streptomyces wuyuanensis]
MPDGTTGSEGRDLEQLRARIAALEAREQPPARPPRHRMRSALAAVLIVIGCVLAPLSAVATWAKSEVGDTDRYVATVAPLASDPDVQAAVANRVTNVVMEHIDLPALLEDVAPADRPRLDALIGRLGGALENAVRSFVQARTQDIVASEAFQRIWTDANRRIHAAVDKALTGSGGGAIELTDNAVKIDLAPVIEQVKQRLVNEGLTIAEKIPEIHTDFTVLQSEEVGRVKTGFRLLQLAGTWLPIVAVVLIAAGVLLSAHRRKALVAAALGVAVATALLGAGLTVFRLIYLDSLPKGVSQPAATSVFDALVRFLRTTIRNIVMLGVVVALAAWLTGPGRYAGLVRQLWTSGIAATRATANRAGLRTGPVGPWVRRYRTWITWVLVAGAVLAYVLWSYPTAWVVVGLALALLFALAIVQFLAWDDDGAAPGPAAREPAATRGPPGAP